jgi:hypothetical protein
MTRADKQPENLKVGKAPALKSVERRRRSLFRSSRRPKPAVVAEFQSDAIEVEERAPLRVARLCLPQIKPEHIGDAVLCLSEIKLAHTDDRVLQEMAWAQCDQGHVVPVANQIRTYL